MSAPDAALRRLAGYRLRRATSALMVPVGEALSAFGLRRTTFSALSVIVAAPGLAQARLAEVLAIERPNMVQIVGDLVSAGLVTRERAEGDRRAYALRATEEGARVQRSAYEAVSRLEDAVTRGLAPAELAALTRALGHVERSAGEVTVDVDPSSA